MLTPWKKSYDKPRQHIKKQRHHFADKDLYSQSYGFSSGHVRMWELDCEEGWVTKIDAFELWCWRILLRVPWTARRSNQSVLKEVSPKGNQSWIFTGRTDAETEAPVLRPPDAKNWLIEIDPDAEKEWRQKKNGVAEDEMVGWHHRLNGHEFEQTLGDVEGQGSLARCSLWGHKELDTT